MHGQSAHPCTYSCTPQLELNKNLEKYTANYILVYMPMQIPRLSSNIFQRTSCVAAKLHTHVHGIGVLKNSIELHGQSTHPCTQLCTYPISRGIKRKLIRSLHNRKCMGHKKQYNVPKKIGQSTPQGLRIFQY